MFRENRRVVLQIMRKLNASDAIRPDRLAERAALAKRIADNSVAGRMVLGMSGTDCDGYRYGPHYSIHTASVMLYEVVRQRNFDGADGPVCTYVCNSPDRETWEAAYECDRCELSTDSYRSFNGLPWDWMPSYAA